MPFEGGFLLAPERVPINPINYPGKRGTIELRPLGVVGVLSSWNYPVALPMRAIVPALVAGNAVAFKPSVDATGIGRELGAAALNNYTELKTVTMALE